MHHMRRGSEVAVEWQESAAPAAGEQLLPVGQLLPVAVQRRQLRAELLKVLKHAVRARDGRAASRRRRAPPPPAALRRAPDRREAARDVLHDAPLDDRLHDAEEAERPRVHHKLHRVLQRVPIRGAVRARFDHPLPLHSNRAGQHTYHAANATRQRRACGGACSVPTVAQVVSRIIGPRGDAATATMRRIQPHCTYCNSSVAATCVSRHM